VFQILNYQITFAETREDVDEDGTIEGRKTVTSTIKFRPTSRDNQVTFQIILFFSFFTQISAINTILNKLELRDLSSLSFHRQIFASLNTSLFIFHVILVILNNQMRNNLTQKTFSFNLIFQAIFACEAQHAALGAHNSPMRVTVVLSVMCKSFNSLKKITFIKIYIVRVFVSSTQSCVSLSSHLENFTFIKIYNVCVFVSSSQSCVSLSSHLENFTFIKIYNVRVFVWLISLKFIVK
jgi:hypothetical protein